MYEYQRSYFFALEIREERYNRACTIARLCQQKEKMPKSYLDTVERLKPSIPTDDWLRHFCNNNGIFLQSKDNLEESRRICCNRTTIQKFFDKFGNLLNQTDERLIFNADETSSILSKKFKALVLSKKSIGAISVPPNEPHITSMLCYNVKGFKIKPFIILSDLKKIPDESSELDAFFCSQFSGWMTSHLFSAFCVFFVAEVNKYRLELPDDIRNDQIILLVDNHPSRYTPYAVEFLAMHNIKLITFPSHSTHVLQPFDVGVAYPLKLNISSFKMCKSIRDHAKTITNKTAKARYLTVTSLINSWNSLPYELLKKSFYASGIKPCNPNIPKDNRNTNQNEGSIDGNHQRLIEMTTQLLTSENNILKLHNQEYGTNYTNIQS